MPVKNRTIPRAAALILALLLAVSLCAPALAVGEESFGTLEAAAAVLLDADTGSVLFTQNERTVLEPASTTKIMTALLVVEAIERGDIAAEDAVTASDAAVSPIPWDASHVTPAIVSGEVMTVADLLRCALIVSDCAACNVLAEYVAGSLEDFTARMNARAAELGCESTVFMNSHGYPEEGHVSTAWDLALISREAMAHPLFAEIVALARYEVPATNVAEARPLHTSNWLLERAVLEEDGTYTYHDDYAYAPCTGIKTGYSTDAGSCLCAGAEQNGIRLISVVLGAGARDEEDGTQTRMIFPESRRLLAWGFEQYWSVRVCDSAIAAAEIPVTGGVSGTAGLLPMATLDVWLPLGVMTEDLDYEVSLVSESAAAPVGAGDILGVLTIKLDGRVLGETELIAAADVALKPTPTPTPTPVPTPTPAPEVYSTPEDEAPRITATIAACAAILVLFAACVLISKKTPAGKK